MPYRFVYLLFTLFFLSAPSADAQRRGRGEEPWPPVRSYSRVSLGAALQTVFEKHYDFCGFQRVDGKRDFTPPSIGKYLGKRDLRTRVETADINGGNLLSYMFSAEETTYPFSEVRYRPDRLLYNRAEGINLLPTARPGFDAFVLTKNCSGYLKSCLDAGLKPPYAAFQAALETDDRRNSSVLALAGSFESPLATLLSANDGRTTELFIRLWQHYQDHPELGGRAYYLRQFDGVMVKHLTNAEEVRSSEQSIGVNISIPLVPKLNASLGYGRTAANSFTGTDWETIVFTDFAGPYTRDQLFAPFPTAEQIAYYFASAPVVSLPAAAQPPLGEGTDYFHRFTVHGLPAELAGGNWRVENLRSGPYGQLPAITVIPGASGLDFSVGGATRPTIFGPQSADDEAGLPLAYELVLPARNGMPDLRIPIQRRVTTTRHPLVMPGGNRFELRRKNNGNYAFQWSVILDVTDRDNPLDPAGRIEAVQIEAGTEDLPLDIRLVEAGYDERRRQVTLLLESDRSWPLREIDDRNMRTLPLTLAVCLPVRGGRTLCRRPLETQLAVPRIRVAEIPPLEGN